jgi:hypothetical protein
MEHLTSHAPFSKIPAGSPRTLAARFPDINAGSLPLIRVADSPARLGKCPMRGLCRMTA